MKAVKQINLFDVEDILENKFIIEKKLIEQNDIDKKLSLQDFITTYLSINHVYVYKQKNTIPFQLTTIAGDDYLILCSENEEHTNKLLKLLKRIDYDLTKLKPIDMFDVKSINDFDNIFYIDNKIYFI